MRKIYQPLKRQDKVFDKEARENYFEKLNQALTNLSIVDSYNEKRIQTVKSRVEQLEEIAS